MLTTEIHNRLRPYIGGIARNHKMRVLEVGGVEDHVHLLLSLPATMEISKAVQSLKGNSSKWLHDEFPQLATFAWQEGYGAFSIGISGVADTIAYIRNQEQHHRKLTFREEFEAILRKHEIQFEPWMLD